MSNRNVASLAFKLAGIYLLAMAASSILTHSLFLIDFVLAPSSYGSGGLSTAGRVVIGLCTFVSLASVIAGGVFLLLASRSLAARTFPELSESPEPRATVSEWQAAAFAVVGIIFVAGSVSTLPVSVGFLIDLSTEHSRWREWLEPAGPVLQFLLGLALFFGARPLAAFWRRLRGAGVPKSETRAD